MMAYLSILNSSSDNLRLKRIINEPKRKIGASTVDAISQISEELGISMYDVMGRAEEFVALSKTKDKLISFVKMIDSIRQRTSVTSERITALFEESGYKAMLTAEGFEGESKIENVGEFISAAVEYENRCASQGIEATTSGFMEEISLVADVDKYDDTADAAVLMTVHAAKGLEFPVVFLAGMEDGIFPSSQNIGEADEMSEERRLAYVAITRAKEKLYITAAKNRMMYGKTAYNPLSCFVRNEIPPQLIERDQPRRVAKPMHSSEESYRNARHDPLPSSYFNEVRRPVDLGAKTRTKSGAQEYGILRLAPETRVTHAMFGDGTVVSARDLGGDVLYEVKFDSGETKKLMATFAKLKKI